MAAAPMAHLAVTALDLETAAIHTRETLERLAERGQQYQPKVFTAAEWRTVNILVDLVIPRDARSGSATDAAVPEFMDIFIQIELYHYFLVPLTCSSSFSAISFSISS